MGNTNTAPAKDIQKGDPVAATSSSSSSSSPSSSSSSSQSATVKTNFYGKRLSRALKAEPPQKVCLSDFKVLKNLGRGSFGKVYLVSKDDRLYAMKKMSKENVVAEKMCSHIYLEKEILATVGNSHPFVVGLSYAFQTKRSLYFVMEYLSGGSLFHHLRESSAPLSKDDARFYAAEIILALEALHERDFLYRDMKLESMFDIAKPHTNKNKILTLVQDCLLDSDGHIRLTDFGLSRRLTPRLRKVRSYSGSNIYVAPEVLADNGGGHGKSVDFWGYGVLLHLLLTQQAPFWSENNEELFAMIREGRNLDLAADYPELHADAVALLEQLLVRDPTKRLGHDADETAALGAEQIKAHRFFDGIDWDAVAKRALTPPIVPSPDYAITHAQIGQEQQGEDISSVSSDSDDDGEEDGELPQLAHFYFEPGMLPDDVESILEPLSLLCRICSQPVPFDMVDSHSKECTTQGQLDGQDEQVQDDRDEEDEDEVQDEVQVVDQDVKEDEVQDEDEVVDQDEEEVQVVDQDVKEDEVQDEDEVVDQDEEEVQVVDQDVKEDEVVDQDEDEVQVVDQDVKEDEVVDQDEDEVQVVDQDVKEDEVQDEEEVQVVDQDVKEDEVQDEVQVVDQDVKEDEVVDQ
jgi:serine/threonine protein kinase